MLKETMLGIWMFGLMTHVGDDAVGGRDTKRAVALITDRNGMQHRPWVLIIDGIPLAPRGRVYYFQPDDEVTFENGVLSGGAEASSKFQRFTPTLAEPLTNSLIDEPVRERRRHDGVVAWIHYPKGALDILGLKPNEGKFYRGNNFVRSQCVTAGTQFNTRMYDDVDMYIKHHDRTRTHFDLRGSALLIIVNQPDDDDVTDEEAIPHFANYGQLFERRFGVVPRRLATVREGDPCEDGDALDPDTTFLKLLGPIVTLPRPQTSLNSQSHAAHLEPDLSVLLGMRVAEHPACTNTDWP